MARTHAHTRGKSHSVRPTSKNAPTWTIDSQDILKTIVDFGKDGMSPSEIGLRLRDEFADTPSKTDYWKNYIANYGRKWSKKSNAGRFGKTSSKGSWIAKAFECT